MNIEHRIKNNEVKQALKGFSIWILNRYSVEVVVYIPYCSLNYQ